MIFVSVRLRKWKRVIGYLLCFLTCAVVMLELCSGFALAQGVNVPRVKENTYVYDDEDLLSDEQESELNYLLRNLEQQTTIEFAVVTTDSFNGMSIEDYANQLFNSLRIGKSGKDNGILFLVSKNEGHGRLEIGYGIDDVLTDSKCGNILDTYYVPNRDEGKDAESVYETARGTLAELGEKYGIELVSNQEEIVKTIQKKDRDDSIKESIVLIIVIVIYFAFRLLIGSGGSGGGHYYGGGYHSSGGGGHFGGGFSGGGGASR